MTQAPARSPLSTHLALASVALLFGTSYVLTKLILRELPPATWAFYRLVLASLSFLPFIHLQRAWPVFREPRLWLCGFFGIALNQLLFIEGLARTTPSHSALINATIPALTMVFSILAGREHWRLSTVLGVVCAMLGVGVLIGRPQGGQLSGDLLTLANSASYAFYFVLSQPLARRYPAFGLTGCFVLEGAVLAGLYAFTQTDWRAGAQAWSHASTSTHLLMVFVAITATTVTYSLNSWALKRAVPSQVTVYITAQPLVATAMSSLLLGEPLHARFLPAFVLVSVGVLFASGAWASLRKRSASRG